jgi:hypothetical protein
MPYPNNFSQAQVVTKSDTVDIFNDGSIAESLWVGGVGDVTVVMLADKGKTGPVTTLFSAVPAGTLLPIRCSRVMSTGTGATLMVALRP